MRPRDLTGFAASLLLLGACAVRAAPAPATHPASPAAPIGRLAGPPASLRAGAVSYPDVPIGERAAPPPHHGHHHAP